MKICDFRSCFAFSTAADENGIMINTCRSQILSRCEMTNLETGKKEEFFLAKECIGEHVYLEGGIAQVPTSEVCVIFTREGFELSKKFVDHKMDLVQIKKVGEKSTTFTGKQVRCTNVGFHFKTVEGHLLETTDDIIKSTLESKPIVARTTLKYPEGGWCAVIEYPVIYMNIHTGKKLFQIDVGPVLFPNFSSTETSLNSRMELAYILYKEFDRAEFVIRVPTPVQEGSDLETLHYSKVIYTNARNELFCLRG